MRTLLVCLLVLIAPRFAAAQFKDATSAKGPTLGAETTTRVKLGVIVTAGGNLFNATATIPVPAEWPEQQVRVVNEETSPAVRNITYRNLTGGGGNRQMVVEIPQLPAGQEAKALITFEVTHHNIEPPTDTSIYVIPKRLNRAMLLDIGPSPYIESRHPKVTAAAKEALEGKDELPAWQQVEALYDWTRDHIAYKDGKLKGAARAWSTRKATPTN